MQTKCSHIVKRNYHYYLLSTSVHKQEQGTLINTKPLGQKKYLIPPPPNLYAFLQKIRIRTENNSK